ncbi:MAG TPA: TonB-dependent receptor [Acidisarcina sp.]
MARRVHLYLAVVLLGVVLSDLNSPAQSPANPNAAATEATGSTAVELSGQVVDERGAAIAGGRVVNAAGHVLVVTDGAGSFHLTDQELMARLAVQDNLLKNLAPFDSTELRIEAAGFETVTVTYTPGVPLRVVMRVQGAVDSVTVTAYRTPLASADSPAATRILTTEALDQAASPAFDNKLRLVPGVELFRRSSSLVANPTSQGLSLRGLGSTAASRTLVVSGDVPLNDPYGGWIHWTEPPELSVSSIELVRGGASDLYGSSAIGGVVNVIAQRPEQDRLSLLSSYGGENTLDEAALGSAIRGKWSGLAGGGILRTDGYTLIAPGQRGAVDIPSNVHSQNGVIEADHAFPRTGRLFLRGSGFNEARSNGTPLQTNATRLWRYSGGVDLPTPALSPRTAANLGGLIALRLYGSEEHYRQSFSAIAAGRASESQTRFEHTPAEEMGAVLHVTQPLNTALMVVAGADTHDVRATDTEQSLKAGKPVGLLDTTARQRQTGVYGEALWTPHAWTVSGGARIDHFTNFDAAQSNTASSSPSPVALPTLSETVFDPRLGVSHRLLPARAGGPGALFPGGLVWSASAFRAYRAPTQNELYRTGQVGQETTQPNNTLRSERATGWETGLFAGFDKATVRVSYFWTQVNRPITALTLSSTPTLILDKRENLGQIESRGFSVDFEANPLRWIALTGGYQFADATVTRSVAQAAPVGNWIPQVARNTATAQLRISRAALGTLSLQGRLSGRQFDDAGNRFLLHGYFRLDAYAAHDFGGRIELFASGENLFDRTIEVGRTPTLTLGSPALARIGLRIRLGD